MQRAIITVLAACLIAGCDEGDRQRDAADKEKASKQSEERSARRRAEREAEEKLMRDAAINTIDARLNEWISSRDGLYYFRGNWTLRKPSPSQKSRAWHAMPTTMPWYIKCGDGGGLSVTLGPWTESSEREETEDSFGVELTDARLSDEQCRVLVAFVGARMNMLASGKP